MELKKNYVIALSFVLPLAAMIGYMMIFMVEPFGSNSFLIIDGLHQYMPFFSVLYDKLKAGDSLFYSFRAGLGINFLSLFAYYLSSPFNLFLLLFKKTQLNMAVSLLVVLKIALSGLTAGIYFTSRTKKPDVMVLVCALAYSLNSYMVGYCWNVMWLDAIMIFPIIVMGIERIIEKGDGRLYGIALFYALFCNYYIAFMICIFSVFWYILASFQSFRQFIYRGLIFAGYSLLAAGMAAVLLIPAYLGIRQTTSGGAMGIPEHGWQTGFADLMTRQFTMVEPISHDNFDGNANLYLGVFAVFAVVLYMLNKEISLWDKVKKGALLLFFYVSFSEDILNFIWHGFHNQFGIPNRFSFLSGFLILYMLFEVMERKDSVKNWQVVLGCVTGMALLYISRSYGESPLEDGVYGMAGMLLLLYGVLLLVMCINKKYQKMHVTLFACLAMAELCITAGMGFDYIGQINVPKFFSGTEDVENAAASLEDGTFCRSELAAAKMVDENAWYPFKAVGLFGSTATDRMVTMMDSLGFYTGCNEYLYKGATPVTNLLLGVRYLYYHPEDVLDTEFSYKDTFGDFAVYENPVEVSAGYMIHNDIKDWYYESSYPFRVQNEFCSLGYGIHNIFENIEIADPSTTGCTASRTNDGEYYFEYEEASPENMVFTIPIEKHMENLYLFYDGTQVNHAKVYVDGTLVKEGDIDGLMNRIGVVEEGSILEVYFELKGETETGYVRLSAADFKQNLFDELTRKMQEGAFRVQEMSSGKLSGTVKAKENQTLLLSIPYDSGWKVLVDGKKAKTETVGNAFLAVRVPEGDHEISMTFTPEGFVVGWPLSLCSILLYLLLYFSFPTFQKRQEEKRRNREEAELKEQENMILGLSEERKSGEKIRDALSGKK